MSPFTSNVKNLAETLSKFSLGELKETMVAVMDTEISKYPVMMIDVEHDEKTLTALEISVSPSVGDQYPLVMACVKALKEASVSSKKTVHVRSEDFLLAETLITESFCPKEGGYRWPSPPAPGDIVLVSGEVYQFMGDSVYSFSDSAVTPVSDDFHKVQSLCSIRKSEGKGEGLFMDLAVEEYTVIAVEPMIRGDTFLPPDITSKLFEKFDKKQIEVPTAWFLVWKEVPFLDLLVDDDALYEKAMKEEKFSRILIEEVLPDTPGENRERVKSKFKKVITNHFGSENGESSLSLLACKINSGEEKVKVMGITTNLENILEYYSMNPLERSEVDLNFFGVDQEKGLENPVVVRVILSVRSLDKDEEITFPYGSSHVV
jgi:hypothetical protein